MVSERERAMAPLGEMDLDEFRRGGHRIVDWIAEYRMHDYAAIGGWRSGLIDSSAGAAARRDQ